MADKNKKELIIIGAGPGGYAAAFRAADLGLKVTLIDPEANPGGACLYHGCIPVKALLHLLKIKQDVADVAQWGIKFEKPEIDVKKIAEWKRKVVKELTEGVGMLSKERDIEFIQGTASFVSEQDVEVENSEGEKSTIAFNNCIIATGSQAKELPDVAFDHQKVINSTDALELNDIPERLLIVGGGYIGPELGSVYATLGSKVTLVEENARFLSEADQDLVKIFEEENKDLFEEVLFNTSVVKVSVEGDKVKVKLKGREEAQEKEFDTLLVATGRKPNTTKLQLDKAGVKKDEEGFIKVNKERKTSAANIYAIGDVTQPPLFANKATHEGRIAAETIAGKEGAVFDPKALPSIVATTKIEMAWCGLSEMEAKKEGIEFKISKFPWTASGRATSIGHANGLTKLILEPESGRVLGGGVVGKNAGSLIPEIALAVEMAATAEELSLTVHPHPTLSETIMEAAELFLGSATHLPGK